MKQISKNYLLIQLFAVLVLIFALAIPAMAVSQGSSSGSQGSSSTTSSQSNQSDQAQQSGTAGSGRLDDAKKKICEAGASKMQGVFSTINVRSQNQLTVMNKIAERVQAFYQNKGLQAANYDELVGELTRTQTAAQNAVQASVQTASQFGCDSDDPKGTANQYKVNVRAHIAAMKEYKNAINDLIVAVKTAAANGVTTREGQE